MANDQVGTRNWRLQTASNPYHQQAYSALRTKVTLIFCFPSLLWHLNQGPKPVLQSDDAEMSLHSSSAGVFLPQHWSAFSQLPPYLGLHLGKTSWVWMLAQRVWFHEVHVLLSFLHPVTLSILKAVKPFQHKNSGMLMTCQGRWAAGKEWKIIDKEKKNGKLNT